MRLSFADGLFWSSVVCCALAQYFIIRSVAGHHLAASSAKRPQRRRGLELVWAIMPAVALAVVLLVTWRAMHPPTVRDRAAALVQELAR